MTQPFEFKNPLDGAPKPLVDDSGKNPFADEDHQPVTDVDADNVYATSGSLPPAEKPEYVTMLTHRGPLLLSLGISNLLICLISGVVGVWQGILVIIFWANGVLAVGLTMKSGLDLQAMRSRAMHNEGRTATLAVMVLSLVTIAVTIAGTIGHWYLLNQT